MALEVLAYSTGRLQRWKEIVLVDFTIQLMMERSEEFLIGFFCLQDSISNFSIGRYSRVLSIYKMRYYIFANTKGTCESK